MTANVKLFRRHYRRIEPVNFMNIELGIRPYGVSKFAKFGIFVVLVSEISKYGSINVNLAWHRDFRFPVPCQICGAQKNKTVIWVTAILNSRSCR